MLDVAPGSSVQGDVSIAADCARAVSEAGKLGELRVLCNVAGVRPTGTILETSEGTVKSHVKAIFSKMNVISRTEAVATATRRGLIQL